MTHEKEGPRTEEHEGQSNTPTPSNPSHCQSEVNDAVGFLRMIRPEGPWVLSSIGPDKGRISTNTFRADQLAMMAAWIAAKDGHENLYWQVNSSGDRTLTKKAAKADIVRAEWLHVDIDPSPNGDFSSQREMILGHLMTFEHAPQIIIDSGGGYQAFWRIKPTDNLLDVEATNRWLGEQLGADHCHNIDRIMRLPFTTNLPNKKKRQAGRQPVPAKLMVVREGVTDIAKLGKGTGPAAKELAPITVETMDFNPEDLPFLVNENAFQRATNPDAFATDGSRNESAFALLQSLVAQDLAPEMILSIVLCRDLPVSDFFYRESSGKLRQDPVKFAQEQLAKATAALDARHTEDYICDEDGKPRPIIDNVEIGLRRRQLDLWYDVHADRTWLGDSELCDNRERHLRFDLREDRLAIGKDMFADMMSEVAWRNRRHPLREKLTSLEWDGIPRIDSFLIDHAGADDNEYVRTVTRIWFLAGARRVLEPGCKFDELLILESPQGGFKSSAMEKLAFGPEWFTDGMPLNGDSKVAIEQSLGKWICEVADMQGRAGDDNKLKAFLSRTHDRARLAYARRATDKPRDWIPVGTTNDSHYLTDVTGNRRFWPVKIDVFDMSFDPEQLWAEAVARRNEPIRMPRELWALAAEQQEQRAEEDPWAEIIERQLQGQDAMVVCGEVYGPLGIPDRDKQRQARQVSATMRRLGFERRKNIKVGGKNENVWVRGENPKYVSLFAPGGDAHRVPF